MSSIWEKNGKTIYIKQNEAHHSSRNRPSPLESTSYGWYMYKYVEFPLYHQSPNWKQRKEIPTEWQNIRAAENKIYCRIHWNSSFIKLIYKQKNRRYTHKMFDPIVLLPIFLHRHVSLTISNETNWSVNATQTNEFGQNSALYWNVMHHSKSIITIITYEYINHNFRARIHMTRHNTKHKTKYTFIHSCTRLSFSAYSNEMMILSNVGKVINRKWKQKKLNEVSGGRGKGPF